MADSSSTLNVLVTASTAGLVSGMDRSSKSVKDFSKTTQDASGTVSGLSSVLGVVSGALAPLLALAGVSFAGFKLFDQLQDIQKIGTAAKMFGDTTENMSALAFAASKTGLSLEDFTSHAHHMSKELGEAQRGNHEAIQGFNNLNIDFTKFGALTFSDQMKVAADRISAMTSPAEQMAVSMKLFGKSGNELLPFLTKGSKGIEELMQKGRDSGQVFGQDAVAGYKNFTKAIGNIQDIVTGVFRQIAVASVPVLSAIGDWVNGSIKYAQDLYTQFTPEIMQLKDVVVLAFTTLKDMALDVWAHVVDGGQILLTWFSVDFTKTLTDWRSTFMITFTAVEVGIQNWWEVWQRIFLRAELSVLTFVNDVSRDFEKMVSIMGVLNNVMTRGIEGTMADIKTIIQDSRPLSPLEDQLQQQINAIDDDLGAKFQETLKKRMDAFNVKAQVAVNQNKLADVSGSGSTGKIEPVAALQKGSVEAMSAIFKDRQNFSAQQLAEQKKGNALLQQIINQANNGGAFIKPLGL